jgi:hypothetical protein
MTSFGDDPLSAASSSRLSLNHRITRRRTRSVSVARSA